MTASSAKSGLVELGVFAAALALAQFSWANIAPAVSITAPASSLTLTGFVVGVIITAAATDADGAVTNVTFFDGADLLGSLTNPPFELRARLEAGTHTLTAQATDNAGATANSTESVVTVTEPSPLIIAMMEPQHGNLALRWSGGSGPFIVQRTGNPADSWCSVLPASLGNSALLSESSEAEFFRVADMGTSIIPLTVSLGGAAVRPNPVATPASGAGTLLLGGTYGGGFWVSPRSLGPVSQGPTFTIEVRADGLTQNRSVVAVATWTPAEPQIVTVSAHEGHKVAVTVQRPGETYVDVVCQGARRQLSISATTNTRGALLVRLAQ